IDEKIIALKLFIKENYVLNFLKSFIKFCSEETEYQLLNYQKTSVTLMLNFIKSIPNEHSELCDQVMKIIGNLEAFEVCVYCSKEIPIGEQVENVIECPECHSDIERCSRTFLLINTPKTLNCDYCYSRSLVFSNEEPVENPTKKVLDQAIFETSSMRYEFSWVKSHDSACVYCRTPLNGLLTNDRVINYKQIKN
ncbi:hypothetical protein DICPUDRAFT_42928, partial [Dictyostelium purpureum]